MAAGKGSSFLLKENSTGTPATIGGLRSTSMTINGEAVDITTKDSNAFITSGNDKARDLLQGGGVRSMTIISKWCIYRFINRKFIKRICI